LKHFTDEAFWALYNELSIELQLLADKNFALLKINPNHPSLHFKRIKRYWSARVGLDYRVIGVDVQEGILWFWIGPHDEYERIIK
jgi:hypothetical protein